jgi:hypothetical protein
MIQIEGLIEVANNLNRIKLQITQKTKEVLTDIALDLQGKAQQLAPVDTGDLRGSASSEVKTVSGGFVAEVGFNEPYALRQHEELGYNHPKGGQAKYLEGPLIENQDKYFAAIKNSINEGL